MSAEAVLEKAPPIQAASVRKIQQDPLWVRWSLTLLVVLVVGVLVVIPVVNVFSEALSEGVGAYLKNLFGNPDTRQSMLLTMIVARQR